MRSKIILLPAVFLALLLQAHALDLKYGKVPDFTLTSQYGKTVSLKNLKGRPWIADFIYTRCSDACPLLTEKMARLQHEFPSKIDFVSFSVDPSHDTPAVLAAYAKRYHAGRRWLFLTGKPKTIARVAKSGFHLALFHKGGLALHSDRLALVDANGLICGIYDSSSQTDLKRLSKDIKSLIRG